MVQICKYFNLLVLLIKKTVLLFYGISLTNPSHMQTIAYLALMRIVQLLT